MDVRIRERLVGALVLVVLVVLLVPALLKGPGTSHQEPPEAGTRSVEIVLDGAAGPTEGERLVPEPEITRTTSDAPAAVTPKAAKSAPPAADAATVPLKSPVAPQTTGLARPVTAQPPAWAVQLGAFSSRSKADRLVADLRSRGYAAFVLEYRADGQLLHRVRVGPEQDRARAAAIAERLRKDGFQTVVAPHP